MMTKQEMMDLLNSDIRNEYTHFHFYLQSAIMVGGLHREEIREFLLESAASEMGHIKEFGDLIVGLGGIPESMPNAFPANLVSPTEILTYALSMEENVVANYVSRINQTVELGGVDGKWIELFLEGHVQDSRSDLDNIKRMLYEQR